MNWRCIVAMAVVLLVGGCKKEAAEEVVLETEEVGAAQDARASTEFDIQARSSEENVGSQMPTDLPSDLPLYPAATLINYGPAEADRRFIELSVAQEQGRVRRRYEREITAAGWQPTGDGNYERSGRVIQVSYRRGTPGTWVRIEYPPSG